MMLQKLMLSTAHAKRRGFLGKIARERMQDILAATECYYCDTKFGDGHPPEVDHFYPLGLGGSNADDNIVLCCDTCNSSKM